jgi:hypothetical protein
MKFVLQVYFNGAQERVAQLTEDERQAVIGEYVAFFQTPEVQDGNQLQPPATATTVRVRNGATVASPGSFAGSADEPLGGYYVVEAADMDSAVALAARIPATRMGGSVEVRPVVER